MGTIVKRANEKFHAKVRRVGFPKEAKTFSTHEAAQDWISEREAFLLAVKGGGSPKLSEHYLHIKTGKPRAISVRPYQNEAVCQTHNALVSRPTSVPLISLPTASGKTIVIAALIERLLSFQKTARFLVLTHTKELVEQDYNKFILYSCLPETSVGIASSSFGRFDLDKQVIFATIQTIAAREFCEHIDFIFIDEAHLLPEHEESQYRRTLAAAILINPRLRIVGLTATPFRTDSGLLTEGSNALFTEISYEANIKELIRDKYLSLLISSGSTLHVDESALIVKGADFDEAISEREMMGITPEILAQVLKQGRNRCAWMVFCVSIAHANQVAEAISKAGISCKVVSSAESVQEREKAIYDFKVGQLQALVNVNILTTGFDAPNVDLIVSLRPTISTSLWVQICGRGMRIADGKQNCLVLDFANNIARHGPIDAIHVTGQNGVGSVKWSRQSAIPCPSCNTLCGPRVLVCPNCNNPLREGRILSLEDVASTLPILRLDAGQLSREHRLKDLRDIIKNYDVAAIANKLRLSISSLDYLNDFYKVLPTYQALLDEDYIVEALEPTYSIDEVAQEIGRSCSELCGDILKKIFPEPRVFLEELDGNSSKGYSLLQLAAIKSGLAGKLLECDVTILWYQHMANLVELDLKFQ